MVNMRGFLDAMLCSAVIAGQDSMPKFRIAYANFFGRIEPVRLNYLLPDEARALAETPTSLEGRSRFRGSAIDRIVALTAGNPYYMQIVCARLVRHLNEVRSPFITASDVARVCQSLVDGPQRLDQAPFDPLIAPVAESAVGAASSHYLRFLSAVAHATAAGRGVGRDELRSFDGHEMMLHDLRERDVVSFDAAQRVSLRVGLFAEWLRVNRLGEG